MAARILLAGEASAARLLGADVPDVHHVAGGDVGDIDASVLADRDAAIVAVRDPLVVLRRLHALDPALQLIALVAPDERQRLQRTMLFTPGLGEVWLVEDGLLEESMLERAAAVTAARRGYDSIRRRAADELALVEPHPNRRAVVTDAFLATLLRGIPDPVISLDDDDRVLSWNSAAERLFAIPRADAHGRSFTELVDIVDEGGGEPRADGIVARLVRYRRGDGEPGFGELIRMPVEWGGRTITAVVLHDETALRRSQGELEQQAAELEEQTVELETANEELHRQRSELRDALASRSRFYAAMSHELRTPINAILGYNALLLENLYGDVPPAQRAPLERAQRAARHLLELVNDVLDLAKIEAGRIEIRPERVALPAIIDELLDTVSALADENGAELSVDGPSSPHEIRSDPRRVRQILLNLISNALKFGHGNPVDITWKRSSGGGAEIAIRDRGPGIAPADQQRIFREFEQVPADGVKTDDAGTGLGLSISDALATLLGGSIRLESEPGKGSTFTLVLPATAPSFPPQPS